MDSLCQQSNGVSVNEMCCWSFQEPLEKLEDGTITMLRDWDETGFKDTRLTSKYSINLYAGKS